MLDIRFIRENPDVVKENIKKKFQDEKLPLVDRVLTLDGENRAASTEASELRSPRNTLSKQVGILMGQAKKDPSKLEEAEAAKAQVKANADRLAELEKLEELRAEPQQAIESHKQKLEARIAAVRQNAEDKLHTFYARQDFFERRMLHSFPTLRSSRHPEALSKLREYLANRKK